MNVDDICLGIKVIFPDFFQKHGPGHRLTRMTHHEFQKLKLTRLQVDILTLTPGGGYGLSTGTSQAAATVSGIMALLRTLRPDLTPAAALTLIGSSSKDLGTPGPDADFGAGRVDAESAIEALGKVQQASQ